MKKIKQLSVFLENKFGRLNEILHILGTHNIDIIAASVADTSEYGILRIITTDTVKAHKVLREANVSANISEVIAIECNSSAMSYANELAKLADGGIHIEYMYTFRCNCKSVIILRTSDNEKALETANNSGVCTLTQSELSNQTVD